jgi:hypothetical protein
MPERAKDLIKALKAFEVGYLIPDPEDPDPSVWKVVEIV